MLVKTNSLEPCWTKFVVCRTDALPPQEFAGHGQVAISTGPSSGHCCREGGGMSGDAQVVVKYRVTHFTPFAVTNLFIYQVMLSMLNLSWIAAGAAGPKGAAWLLKSR